jgi:hypothetical protein
VVQDQEIFFGHNQRKKREKREERENGKYLFICEEREGKNSMCDQTKFLGPGSHKSFSCNRTVT